MRVCVCLLAVVHASGVLSRLENIDPHCASVFLAVVSRNVAEPSIVLHRGPILEAEHSLGLLAGEGTGAVLHANVVGGVCDAVGLAAVTVNGFLNQERCLARHDWDYERWMMGFALANYSDTLLHRAKPRLHGGEGDPSAQAQLGIAFADGLGVEKCMLCAKQWFELVLDPDESRTGTKNASDPMYKFWIGVSAVRMAQLYVDNALSMASERFVIVMLTLLTVLMSTSTLKNS